MRIYILIFVLNCFFWRIGNTQSTYFNNIFDNEKSIPNSGNTISIINGNYYVVGNGSKWDYTKNCFVSTLDIFTFSPKGEILFAQSSNYSEAYNQSTNTLVDRDTSILLLTNRQLCAHSDSNYVVRQRLSQTGTLYGDQYLLKGNVQDMIKTENGGYILCGAQTLGFPEAQISVWQLDSTLTIIGDTVFQKLGSEGTATAILPIPNNQFLICATLRDTGNTDTTVVLLMESDNVINLVKEHKFELSGRIVLNGAMKAKDGGFLLYGSNLGSGTQTAQLLKFDNQMKLSWVKNINQGASQDISTIHEMADGSLVATLTVCGFGVLCDGLLVKMNALGDTIWTQKVKYPGAETNTLLDFIFTSDQGYLLTGSAEGDLWIVKTDSLGCDGIICGKTDIQIAPLHQSRFLLEPNPCNNQIMIRASNEINVKNGIFENYQRIRIMDIYGKRLDVPIQIAPSGIIVDCSSLNNGLYFFVIENNNKTLMVQKFVVQE